MIRVCADGGLLEIWHPHAAHSDAFVLGYISYLSERIYDHVGCSQRDFLKTFSGRRGGRQWILEEICYDVDRLF